MTGTEPDGRPPFSIGIDVGGTKVLGVVVDPSGTVLSEHRIPTPLGAEALVATMVEVVEALRPEAGDVTGFGAGLPGLIDRNGTLRFAPNLPGVVEVPVGPLLEEATGLAVRLENDATCAMWAEHQAGAAMGVDHAMLATVGTGIGGGIVLDGRLVRGANGFAGEIGHMVVEVDGLPCACGRRGCWEQYASGSALRRQARALAEVGRAPRLVEMADGDPDRVKGEHVTAAATEGDEVARELMDRFAGWFSAGLASLVHILDIERCVVGGGLVEAGDVFLDPVRRALADRLVAPDHRPAVDVVPAAVGEHAGAIGAALLAPT